MYEEEVANENNNVFLLLLLVLRNDNRTGWDHIADDLNLSRMYSGRNRANEYNRSSRVEPIPVTAPLSHRGGSE